MKTLLIKNILLNLWFFNWKKKKSKDKSLRLIKTEKNTKKKQNQVDLLIIL